MDAVNPNATDNATDAALLTKLNVRVWSGSGCVISKNGGRNNECTA